MAEYTCTMERTIALLLEEKKYMTLRDILVTMNPSDVAALFEALPEDRRQGLSKAGIRKKLHCERLNVDCRKRRHFFASNRNSRKFYD